MGLLGSVPESPAEEGAAFLALLAPLSSSPPYLLYQAGMPLREDSVLPALHGAVQLYTGRYACKVNVSTTQYVSMLGLALGDLAARLRPLQLRDPHLCPLWSPPSSIRSEGGGMRSRGFILATRQTS